MEGNRTPGGSQADPAKGVPRAGAEVHLTGCKQHLQPKTHGTNALDSSLGLGAIQLLGCISPNVHWTSAPRLVANKLFGIVSEMPDGHEVFVIKLQRSGYTQPKKKVRGGTPKLRSAVAWKDAS